MFISLTNVVWILMISRLRAKYTALNIGSIRNAPESGNFAGKGELAGREILSDDEETIFWSFFSILMQI